MQRPNARPKIRLPKTSRVKQIKQDLKRLSGQEVEALVKNAGSSSSPARSLLAKGLNARRLRAIGYPLSELRAVGYLASDLRAIGYPVKALIKSGYPASELIKAGFSQAEVNASFRKK